eukprot:gb/GECH01002930.1/.p1 GENE.gb/GECH01002930.1/~~gb/GECH01002930.1/.p1  ORF type:complete len:134 (+),score=50.24 gb/GECH01002930.1/:1-402(+)
MYKFPGSTPCNPSAFWFSGSSKNQNNKILEEEETKCFEKKYDIEMIAIPPYQPGMATNERFNQDDDNNLIAQQTSASSSVDDEFDNFQNRINDNEQDSIIGNDEGEFPDIEPLELEGNYQDDDDTEPWSFQRT